MSTHRESTDLGKRRLLGWTPPLVLAVALPRHAHATHDGVNNSAPVATLTQPPTCKMEESLTSHAAVTIYSDYEEMTIYTIEHDAPAEDMLDIPSLPANVDLNNGLEISWQGPSVDAMTCHPVNSFSLTITYNSNDDHDGPFTVTIPFTDLIAAA